MEVGATGFALSRAGTKTVFPTLSALLELFRDPAPAPHANSSFILEPESPSSPTKGAERKSVVQQLNW